MDETLRRGFETIAKSAIDFLDEYKTFHDQLSAEERRTTGDAGQAVIRLGRSARDVGLYVFPKEDRKEVSALDDMELINVVRFSQQAIEAVSNDANSDDRALTQRIEALGQDKVLSRLGRVEAGFVAMNIATPQASDVYGRWTLESLMTRTLTSENASIQIEAIDARHRRDQLTAIADAGISFIAAAHRTGLLGDLEANANRDDIAAARLASVRGLGEKLVKAGYRIPKSENDVVYDFRSQKPDNSIESLVDVKRSANLVSERFTGDEYIKSFSWSGVALHNLENSLDLYAGRDPRAGVRAEGFVALGLSTVMEAADLAMTLSTRAYQNTTPSSDWEARPKFEDQSVILPSHIGGRHLKPLFNDMLLRLDTASAIPLMETIESVNAYRTDEKLVPAGIVTVANRMSPPQIAATTEMLDALVSVAEHIRPENRDRTGVKPKDAAIEKELRLKDERGYVVPEEGFLRLDNAVGQMISNGAYARLSELSGRGPGVAAIEGSRHEVIFARDEMSVEEATRHNEELYRREQDERISAGRATRIGKHVVPMEMSLADYQRLPDNVREKANPVMAVPGQPLFESYDGLPPGAFPRGTEVIWARNRAINHAKETLMRADTTARKMERLLLDAEGRPIVAPTRSEAEGLRIVSNRLVTREIEMRKEHEAKRNTVGEKDEVLSVHFDKTEMKSFMTHLSAHGTPALLVKIADDHNGSRVALTGRSRNGEDIKPVVGRIDGDSSVSRMRDGQRISIVPAGVSVKDEVERAALTLVNQRVATDAIINPRKPERAKAEEQWQKLSKAMEI